MNAAFTGDPQDVRTWGRLDPLAPHAEAVAAHADAAGIADADRATDGCTRHAVPGQGAVRAGGTAVAPRARHRRGKPRQGPSERRDRPQQPRHVAASHQPARRSGTADAPRARHRRGKPRQGPSERRDPPQQPCPVAASHQPARRGGTAVSPRASPSPRQASARTIRTSRTPSTTSPSWCKRPIGSARRNR